jgi:hypothetical protein
MSEQQHVDWTARLAELAAVQERSGRYVDGHPRSIRYVPTNASRAAHDRAFLVDLVFDLLAENVRLRGRP